MTSSLLRGALRRALSVLGDLRPHGGDLLVALGRAEELALLRRHRRHECLPRLLNEGREALLAARARDLDQRLGEAEPVDVAEPLEVDRARRLRLTALRDRSLVLRARGFDLAGLEDERQSDVARLAASNRVPRRGVGGVLLAE